MKQTQITPPRQPSIHTEKFQEVWAQSNHPKIKINKTTSKQSTMRESAEKINKNAKSRSTKTS